MAESITIYDIARECSVAPATVSKVFNNYTGINHRTKQKVLCAAEKLNYKPNMLARNLATKKAKNLGVLVNTSILGFSHHVFSEIFNSFKSYTDTAGYDITILPLKLENGEKFSEHCRMRLIEGVFAFGHLASPEIQELFDSGITVVAYDYGDDKVSGFTCNNYTAMRSLAEYAAEQGHKRPVFICGEDNYVTNRRIEAFKDVCGRLGIDGEENIVHGAYYNPALCNEITEKLLKRNPRPSVIFYPDDYTALYAMRFLSEKGILVPDDISVAGFDGIEMGLLTNPRLTTVKQDTVLLGRLIAEKLINGTGDKKCVQGGLSVLDAALIKGGSVGAVKAE